MFEMKPLKVALVGVEENEELKALAREYALELRGISGAELKRGLSDFGPDVVIADEKTLSSAFASVPQEARPSIFLAVNEGAREFPAALDAGLADDVIVRPFRRLELLSRLRWHNYLHALRSVEGINANVRKLTQRIEEDLVFAQKIQRRLIKDRFPPMSGISIKSKYWCGLKGGGDYFDVFEFADKNHIGFILTDVSSYKLSSAFISAMLALPARLDGEAIRDPQATVRRIHGELRERMDEKETYSIFYGVLDRKSFVMRYVAFGSVFLGLQSARGARDWIYKGSEDPLTRESEVALAARKPVEISFEPEDRLYIVSDGLEESLETPIPKFLDAIEDRDPQAIVNEVSFAIRTKHDPDGTDAAEGETPMPPQDCSLLVVDVAKNILRLAR